MNQRNMLMMMGGAVALLALVAWTPTAAAVELISPAGGEFLSGTTTIEWVREETDSTIELKLHDEGVEIEPKLCEDCPGTTYVLDTTLYAGC